MRKKLNFYNEYKENFLYNNVQNQLHLFIIKNFYHIYLSQITLKFNVKTIKKAMFNINQKKITQTQMQKYFAKILFSISSITSQQTFDQFKQYVKIFKLFTTLMFIFRTNTAICTFTILNGKNLLIYNVLNDNSSKK